MFWVRAVKIYLRGHVPLVSAVVYYAGPTAEVMSKWISDKKPGWRWAWLKQGNKQRETEYMYMTERVCVVLLLSFFDPLPRIYHSQTYNKHISFQETIVFLLLQAKRYAHKAACASSWNLQVEFALYKNNEIRKMMSYQITRELDIWARFLTSHFFLC